MNKEERSDRRQRFTRRKTSVAPRYSDEELQEFERRREGQSRRGAGRFDRPRRENNRINTKREDNNDQERKTFERKPFERKPFARKPFGSGEERQFEERRSGKYGHHDYNDDERPTRQGFGSRGRSYNSDHEDRHDRKFAGASAPRRQGGFRRREKDPLTDRPRATGEIRLNKYLADSGICSRRDADDIILSGAVTVNGKVVTELGTKVRSTDKVVYGGQTLNREKLRYILLNKPKGVITTSDDPYERHTVMELVEGACDERIYPVGRLDRNTLGLLLLTNDGELAKTLTHPSHEVEKLYHVVLNKPLTKADFDKISKGLMLEDGPIQVDELSYVDDDLTMREVGVKIHSGRNHIVRRIFESLGYEISKLDRVMLAGLTKQNLPRGHYRFLTPMEINMLKNIK